MSKSYWTEKEREQAKENTDVSGRGRTRGKTGSLPAGYDKGKKVTEQSSWSRD